MTYAEILVEALHLMGLTDGEKIQASDQTVRQMEDDPAYADKLAAARGSLNRGFSDLENRQIVPLCSAVIRAENIESDGDGWRLDAAKLLPEGGEIVGVTALHVGDPAPIEGEDYEIDESGIRFPNGAAGGRVLYRRALPRVGRGTDLDAPVPLPDRVAALLPCFLAGELMETDEPELSAAQWARYEAGIDALRPSRVYGAGRVELCCSLAEV